MTDHIGEATKKVIDLDALEQLADEATPGPWFAGPLRPENECAGPSVSVGPFDLAETYGGREDYSPEAFDSHYEETILECWGDNHDATSNAAFITALNPATIKALIAELKEARGLLKEARWYVNDHQDAEPNDESRDLLAKLDGVLK